LLTVGDNIDAAIDLVADNLRHCASDPPCVGVIVVDFALTFAFIISSRSFGRAILPQWVVRIRSVLRFMVDAAYEFESRAALRIVPQPLEEVVAQWDHCIVLIDQYVANGGSHVFQNVSLSSRPTVKADLPERSSPADG